jgi:mono/diheme cytochrome c family protein
MDTSSGFNLWTNTMKIAKILIVTLLSVGPGVTTKTFSFSPQTSGSKNQGSPDVPKGNLQRSAEILYFKRLADSGSERGKEIYFYKCWVCHNDYTRAAGSIAPTLRDLYKRPKLLSGESVNDQTVAAKIKNGGPNMPGYQYTLTEQDLSDLVGFLREGKCCWEDSEEKEPPRNPRYKAR